MGNITYQYKSPTARQVDGWTCGYRALLAITNPDDQFQLGAVRTIKKDIVEAHKENEQRKNSQKPAAASNTSTNHLTEDILQKMAKTYKKEEEKKEIKTYSQHLHPVVFVGVSDEK